MNHPAFPFRQIGDFQITALSDGNISANLDLLAGIDNVDAAVIQHDAGVAVPGNIHINCYLIRGREKTILVDTGAGTLNNVGGQLKANLAAAGVGPDNVDTILLTHCHPDHIGGLLDTDGVPVYKHAALHLHTLEAKYWLDDKLESQASERGKRNFALVRQTLKAYAHNLHLINEEQITQGILPIWLPGHTPGHTGFRIDSGGQSLLIWGDIVHFPHIQSTHPAVSIAFDIDPAQARETREKILAQAVREKLLIAGMHLDTAGFAHIRRGEAGYCIAYQE